MTVTVEVLGAGMVRDFRTALRREVDDSVQQAARAKNATVDDIREALARFRETLTTIDSARWEISTEARELVKAALRAGVDPRELYDLPFSDTIVRRIMRELGMEMPKPGPRPRRGQSGDASG